MVIPGHNLGNSQVSVNMTIGPTLVIFNGLFYLHSEQVGGNTVVCTLGRAARRSNVSDYVYRRHQHGLKCSCLTDKQSCTHLENAHLGINLILNYR